MAKKQLTLSIPTPCTENWNNMTPDKNGKFCGSCQKTVVDFSRMTDTEIFNYFDSFQGATCGRFTEKQLTTPFNAPLIVKPQNRWAWALSALLLPTLAASQTVKMSSPIEIFDPSVFESKSSVGGVFLTIKGEVNELGGNFLPVDGAIVAVHINDKIVAYGQTDSLGIFLIDLSKSYENQSFILEVSQIGFEKERLLFDNFAGLKARRLFISLKNVPIAIQETVVCSSYSTMKCYVTTGITSVTVTGELVSVSKGRFRFFQRTQYRIKRFFHKLRNK